MTISPSVLFALAATLAVVLAVDVLDMTAGHVPTVVVAFAGALVARAVTR